MYSRSESTGYRELDRFDDGVGWLAHPEERGQRASHAISGPNGCWLLDPLWAPGIEELIAEVGDVVGIAVCSAWHARDADRFAELYDVPVSVPEWMGRVDSQLDAPIVGFDDRFASEPLTVVRSEPIPGWSEAFLYWESHETLYIPDSLGTIDPFTLGDERLGLELLRRFDPPRTLRTFEPDRVLVGHGEGILEDATRTLEYALAERTKRLPRAIVENGPETMRSLVGAVRD